MATQGAMTIRVRAPTGQARIKTNENETMGDLFVKMAAQLKITESFAVSRTMAGVGGGKAGTPGTPGGALKEISASETGLTLGVLGIRHGDMLSLTLKKSASEGNVPEPVLDGVDRYLDTQRGLVAQKRDPRSCFACDATRRCINCSELEPYDPKVLGMKDPPIKFLSFHSHIRQLQSGADRGRLINMQELRCLIDKNCKSCPGYPKGICSKCQPSAITISRQKFRHVDQVQFESGAIMEKFMEGWRNSGLLQRVGWLYGTYEHEPNYPLGIKAVVQAIYEPPQVNEVDGFELLDDENDKLADALAAGIGMTRVGWIFTDLHVDPALKAPANVSFTRDMSDTTTVFTAGELLQAAYLQSQRPNIVSRKYCSEGNFGSKFVSVVMSGDKDNFAAPTAFQASNEAVAMAKADILAPSTTAANEMLVQLSDDTRYVPEIYYTHKNEYNKEVKSSASPSFPSDYLMCDMQAAFRKAVEGEVVKPDGFAVENREGMGEMQDIPGFYKYLQKPDSLLLKLSNFHALHFLATNTFVSLKGDDLDSLLKALATKDEAVVDKWATASPKWATLMYIMAEQLTDAGPAVNAEPIPEWARVGAPVAAAAAGGGGGGGGGGSGGGSWACSGCTFINESGNTCNICQTSR